MSSVGKKPGGSAANLRLASGEYEATAADVAADQMQRSPIAAGVEEAPSAAASSGEVL